MIILTASRPAAVVALTLVLATSTAWADGWLDSAMVGAARWGDLVVSTTLSAGQAAGGAVMDALPTIESMKSYGPSFPTLDSAPDPVGGMDDATKQSIGCLIGGTSGMAIASYGGSLGAVNLIAGGLVPAANPAIFTIGMVGVVFASFCSVGQALTPLYLHYIHRPDTGGGQPSTAPAPRRPDPLTDPNAPQARIFRTRAPTAN